MKNVADYALKAIRRADVAGRIFCFCPKADQNCRCRPAGQSIDTVDRMGKLPILLPRPSLFLRRSAAHLCL